MPPDGSDDDDNDDGDVLFVAKADPITFPTPEPGAYAVAVNANDVYTAGALPFGFSPTILLPVVRGHCWA